MSRKPGSWVISKPIIDHSIKLSNQEIKQVSSAEYLGLITSEEGIFDDEINLNRALISKKEVSAAVFTTVNLPTLIYSVHTWTSKNKSILQAAEMSWIRRIEDKIRKKNRQEAKYQKFPPCCTPTD